MGCASYKQKEAFTDTKAGRAIPYKRVEQLQLPSPIPLSLTLSEASFDHARTPLFR